MEERNPNPDLDPDRDWCKTTLLQINALQSHEQSLMGNIVSTPTVTSID